MSKKRKKRNLTLVPRRKTRRITPLRMVGWFSLVAFVGLAVFLTIDLIRGSGDDGSQVVQPAITPVATRTGAAPEPYAGGARLYLPQTEVDLGDVPLMTPVSHSFKLENVGDAPLVISKPTVAALQGC